jgi:hypothetical protein
MDGGSLMTVKGFIYVAGPMTGIPEFNIPAFNLAGARLMGMGWAVENPADNGGDGTRPWDWYMRQGIKQLMRCDTIGMLDGWQKSRGAVTEARIALTLGMAFYEVFPAEPDDADVLDLLTPEKAWAAVRWAEEGLRI